MLRGYVKLWRRSIDNGWLQNHLLWAFWCWCLLKASHKQKEITVGFQRVMLEPGQFVFGRNNAAKELRASPQNIRTCVQTLIKSQNLTIKSTNKFSIISIINWDSYQQDENKINQQTNKPLTSNQPTTNHKQTHKHKSTKEKRIKTSSFCRLLPDRNHDGVCQPQGNHARPRSIHRRICPQVPSQGLPIRQLVCRMAGLSWCGSGKMNKRKIHAATGRY